MIKANFITLKKAGVSIFLLSLLTAGCRTPTAEFELDREEYSAGSIVHITNNSAHGKKFLWHFSSDGYNPYTQADSKEESPNDTINMLAEDGIHHIQMTAYSKGEHKSKTVTKSFLVKTLRGTLNIQAPSYYQNVQVLADNQKIGTLNNGYLSVQLPVGVHYIAAMSPYGKKAITLTISQSMYTYFQIQ